MYVSLKTKHNLVRIISQMAFRGFFHVESVLELFMMMTLKYDKR